MYFVQKFVDSYSVKTIWNESTNPMMNNSTFLCFLKPHLFVEFDCIFLRVRSVQVDPFEARFCDLGDESLNLGSISSTLCTAHTWANSLLLNFYFTVLWINCASFHTQFVVSFALYAREISENLLSVKLLVEG